MMKFRLTITFTKIISLLIAIGSILLSWALKDSVYWNIGIPAAAGLSLGRDVATNFGKNAKNTENLS